MAFTNQLYTPFILLMQYNKYNTSYLQFEWNNYIYYHYNYLAKKSSLTEKHNTFQYNHKYFITCFIIIGLLFCSSLDGHGFPGKKRCLDILLFSLKG